VIVLGIETAGPRGGVALLLPGQAPHVVEFESSGRLGAELAPTIQRMLKAAKLSPSTPPDLVAVDVGPGSYTGLRIGLAAAKGLAFAWGRPLISVSSTAALEAQAPDSPHLLCALDASRGDVYAVLYGRAPGGLRCLREPHLTRAETLLPELPNPTLVVGDAAGRFADAARGVTPAGPEEAEWPSALTVATLGQARFMAGDRPDALRLSPIYFRANEAEETRRKRGMRVRA
jgi:tRNA threonylcarbamoyladenosine biosynthesis protein TsaB